METSGPRQTEWKASLSYERVTLKMEATKETKRGEDTEAASSDKADAVADEKNAPVDRVELSTHEQIRGMMTRALYEAFNRVREEMRSALAPEDRKEDVGEKLLGLLADRSKLTEADATGQRPIDRLAAEYTPEKTSDRIFNFATSFYDMWRKEREDTEETRQAYADYIGKAIDRGFGEAQNLLGALPDSVQAGINKTHELVFEKLGDFVKNGQTKTAEELSAAQAEGLRENQEYRAVSNDPVALMKKRLDAVG